MPRDLLRKLRTGRLFHYVGAVATRGLEAAGKFGLYMLAARLMGGTDSGLFFLCLTWVNLCATVARMGLERAMSRHIAAELAVGQGQAAKQVLVSGLGWIALGSTAVAGATFLLASPLAVFVFRQPELARPLAIAAAILPPQTVAFAIGFVLIGLSRGVAGQMVQSALPPVLSLIALLAGLDELNTVLAAYAGSYAICCVLGLGFVAWDWHHAMQDRTVPAAASAEPLPTLWVTARPFLVIELVQVALLSVPVLVLGMVAEAASVSAFSILSRLTMLINTILISIAMIAAPAFASHHRRREYDPLRKVEQQTRKLAMVVCLPVIAGMVIFAHPLLSLMGSDVPGASLALYIMAIGQVVNIFFPTQDTMLSMTGHGRILRRLNLQQLIACCVLSGGLIPPFGMIGAAAVSTICLIQGRISFALAVRKVLPQLSTGAWSTRDKSSTRA
jgi:O-antigen/teichoic acid export membrane protein